MDDERSIPLSYISQYNFCKRRAGLLLLECQWNENEYTAKGRVEHQNVHTGKEITRGKCKYITDLTVKSDKMGLLGKCDMMEAYEDNNGDRIPFLENKKYRLFPIEYKHGKLRNEEEYELQLCAQAMCLEEQYKCHIDRGAIYYVSSNRRKDVSLDSEKRERVEETVKQLHKLLISESVPQAEYSSKCIKCSMYNICMPQIVNSAKLYMDKIYKDFEEENE